jgi:hypothetical protein
MVDEEIGMPAKRELSMRQLRHLLRLRHDGVSAREIGRRLGVARSTIQDNLKRAAAAGLAWPLADASPTRLWKRGCMGGPESRKASGGGRAGLGGPGARAQASWRHDDDPLGGISRGSIVRATATAASAICFAVSNGG